MGLIVLLSACSLDVENPNAASEEQVLSTRDGLIALAIGMQQLFQTQGLSVVLKVPSVTTRETAIITTFANLEELENGGAALSGENGYTTRLFSRLTRVKGMSESLFNSVPNVDLDPGTAAGLTAWGHWYRAMCLGFLAHNFEQVPLENSPDNDARFVSGDDAYREAIRLLDQAVSLISSTPPSTLFINQVIGNIDLANTMRLFQARYELMLGEYADAIITAQAIDLNSASYFSYDSENNNPVWAALFDGTVEYAPRDNFGLPDALAPDAGDQRYSFFLNAADLTSLNVLPIEETAAPWFVTATADLPIYRPGEALLIIAEAEARQNNIGPAETALNAVRQRCSGDSPLGFGACLGAFDSGGDQATLLDEIYKQRRIECYLCGTSLADSRRFNRQAPSTGTDFTTERNRNYFPYPAEERLNNPNTPADPPL